jgi:hypothetical protein
MNDCRNFVLALTFLLAACATVSASPQLSSAEVIRLADAEARRHGDKYDPRYFKRANPHYSARFHRWWVGYEPKPGQSRRDAFTIDVDDKTKQTGLVIP